MAGTGFYSPYSPARLSFALASGLAAELQPARLVAIQAESDRLRAEVAERTPRRDRLQAERDRRAGARQTLTDLTELLTAESTVLDAESRQAASRLMDRLDQSWDENDARLARESGVDLDKWVIHMDQSYGSRGARVVSVFRRGRHGPLHRRDAD